MIYQVNHQLADQFADEFEVTFQTTKNGTLKCDKGSIIRIQTFCNDPAKRFLCELTTGVQVGMVQFEDPGHWGDIGTTNRNKTLLLHLYGVWYVFYTRLCATANRQLAAGLLPPGPPALLPPGPPPPPPPAAPMLLVNNN